MVLWLCLMGGGESCSGSRAERMPVGEKALVMNRFVLWRGNLGSPLANVEHLVPFLRESFTDH